jgi:dTDP-4-amino-4,6-dideoxygalactose transaminase/nucleoside-diphosphate-sugar epimerase
MSPPVVITGGCGFVGHALAHDLVRRGRDVQLVDVSTPPAHRPASGPVVIADVRDRHRIDELVAACSAVVHLAAVVGVDDYIQRPAEVVDVNVGGTAAVLDACLRHDKPVLYASSSEVYGMNSERLREDSPSLLGSSARPRWSYAVSKLAGEHLALGLVRAGLRVVITRFFNAYGPLMDVPGQGRIVSKFVGRLLAGRPLQLVDGGRAVRSFCHVDDAARASADLILSLESGALPSGRIFNVGCDEPVTIRELAELVLETAGSSVGTEDVPGEVAFGRGFEDVPRRVPDLSAIAEAIGFRATIDLRTGVEHVLEHWKLAGKRSARRANTIPFVRPRLRPTLGLATDLQAILESGRVTNEGPMVAEFEQKAARYLDVERAVVVSSGSSALELVAEVLARRTGHGRKVLLPSFTYIATLSAFVHAGFEPVFAEIDSETFTLDPEHVEALLGGGTDVAAIVAVNAYGVPPHLSRLLDVARSAQAALVLDAAHGFGTERAGARVERGPVATTYSLHATKTLAAIEGGLVVSDDDALLAEVARLRAHGLAASRLESTPGHNFRMDEIRARSALHRMADLERALERRRGYAARLRSAAVERSGGFFSAQRVPGDVRSSFQNLAFRCRLAAGHGVEEVVSGFADKGVEARRYFDPPLHHLTMFRGGPALPVTDEVYASLVCLPLHDEMAEADLERIEHAIEHVAHRLR